jgi:hypothetical protein
MATRDAIPRRKAMLGKMRRIAIPAAVFSTALALAQSVVGCSLWWGWGAVHAKSESACVSIAYNSMRAMNFQILERTPSMIRGTLGPAGNSAQQGAEVVAECHATDPQPKVLVMVAHGTTEAATGVGTALLNKIMNTFAIDN